MSVELSECVNALKLNGFVERPFGAPIAIERYTKRPFICEMCIVAQYPNKAETVRSRWYLQSEFSLLHEAFGLDGLLEGMEKMERSIKANE